MHLSLTYNVDVEAEKAWDIFGNQFPEIAAWISGVYTSKASDGVPLPGAPSGGRVCQIPSGTINEIINAFDPDKRAVTYTASGPGFPFMVRSVRNTWTFVPTTVNKTTVQVESEIDMIAPFSWFMGPLMRSQFKKVFGSAVDELVHFAKTGKKHPDKEKFDAKPKAKKAREDAALA